MKTLSLVGLMIASSCLVACSSIPKHQADNITQILVDPACDHHDDLTFSAALFGGVNITGHAGRECTAATRAAAAKQ